MASLTRTAAVQAGFGLTQQKLADLLGVARSTITMAGHEGTSPGSSRKLPLAAELLLLQLQQQLPAPYGPAPVPGELPPPALAAYDRETLELRLMKIDLERYPIRQQLTRVAISRAQARLRIQALPALRVAFAANEWAQRWLDDFEAGANLTLRDDSHQPQLLELKLRVLAFEEAEIRQLLG